MKKTAFVTGADGFIGSHLTEFLLSKGWAVKAFCAYNPHSSLGWLDSYRWIDSTPDDLSFVLGDIRDFKSVHEAMTGCSVVFHLAALIGIPYSYKSPLSYIETNVIGTYNILEAAKVASSRKSCRYINLRDLWNCSIRPHRRESSACWSISIFSFKNCC